MTASLIIWLLVATILFALILMRAVGESSHHRRHRRHRHLPVMQLGRESEEFFIPGDPVRPADKETQDPYA